VNTHGKAAKPTKAAAGEQQKIVLDEIQDVVIGARADLAG
jgi:hypothetical protein